LEINKTVIVGRWAEVCPKHVELILEINKTVVVASSWSSVFTLPDYYNFSKTQIASPLMMVV
jgi:hypothetical protein